MWLNNCEICLSKKSDESKKDEKIGTGNKRKIQSVDCKVLICLNEKCKIENDIDEIRCRKCGKFLISGL
jgi:hypothetical protein